MNHKTLLTRYIYFTFILFLLINIYIPFHYKSEYPKKLGPKFTPRVNDEHLANINKSKPELILIGDSTLGLGVNQSLLTEQSNMETYSFAVPGSATAAWYLVMKNIIPKSAEQPKYIAILFRDTMLTAPYFRTTGRYLELLDDYASKNEPLLTKLAFINQMSPLEKFSEKYIPLYGLRWEIRETLDNQLRYLSPSVLGCERECADEAIKSIFGRELNISALSQVMDDAAASLYTTEEMNFDSHIDESFLPPMLELAQKNNTTLIFVRVKTLRYHTLNDQPIALRNYINSLDTYLSSYTNVHYLDFATDERIIDSYFADAIHLNETGRDAFTLILADELSNILK
jgi:hypothetical protein